MPRGIIKFFNFSKSFGFIVPSDGTKDIYFSRASLARDRKYDPVEGDVVEFDMRPSGQGPMAVRIRQDEQP